MSEEDRKRDIRQWVKGLSADELQELLAGILGGGLDDLAPEPSAPPTPEVPDPPVEALAPTDEERRDWLPPEWDPTEFTVEEAAERLSSIGLSTEDLLDLLSDAQPAGHAMPEALMPLVEIASPAARSELAELTVRARTEHDADLTPEDLAAISRPYRYVVDLAGDDGIPLTPAGWMKPAYVQRIYADLDLEQGWIGKGTGRTSPCPSRSCARRARRPACCARTRGHLLPTRLARGLSTDREYVDAVAQGLLRHRDSFVRSARALFALLTAATGRSK